MVDPSTFILRTNRKYPIFLLREPYKLSTSMPCIFYGDEQCPYLQLECSPLAYYVETTRAILYWAHIFSITFKYAIV